MWALARVEWGMTIEEFGELTMGQWEALLTRRTISHRYNCLYSGMVAASVENSAGRTLPENVYKSAFDFVPLPVDVSSKNSLKQNLHTCIALIKFVAPHADMETVRAKAIDSLVQKGYEQGEVNEILEEMFPKWGPKVN